LLEEHLQVAIVDLASLKSCQLSEALKVPYTGVLGIYGEEKGVANATSAEILE
jgi:hypothetical protein